MPEALDPDWQQAVPLLAAGHHRQLLDQVAALREQQTIYPPQNAVLRALAELPFGQVRVVILGQDPYHGPGQADGLAFSVPRGLPVPPSLRNIFKEIYRDTGAESAGSSDLSRWSRQGVLLLNSSLTVEAGKAGSHRQLGWVELTDQIIGALSQERRGLVFILWGGDARGKKTLIDPDQHRILEAVHPSPLSAHRGFFGCAHFSQANAYLQQQGLEPITW